jgi:hypothetical protein
MEYEVNKIRNDIKEYEKKWRNHVNRMPHCRYITKTSFQLQTSRKAGFRQTRNKTEQFYNLRMGLMGLNPARKKKKTSFVGNYLYYNVFSCWVKTFPDVTFKVLDHYE